MKEKLSKLHAKIGDFWWYSLMLFVACRTGDVIQAFIGLWLVPKYVGPQELGAVLPLQQLATFLTIPLAIIAVVFSKYVNTYATRGEYGKVKSFVRDVFATTFVIFVLCIGGAYMIMPFFYERLRIASGSLTLLILLCGLMCNVGTIVSSAQQGLKRFKMMSAMNLISAPIRLVTLLVAMPFRALSGYILGQTTPVATTSALSVLDIHKVLKPYVPDTSWRKDLPEIWRYLWPYAICIVIGTFASTMTSVVYRQRLPEIESSAYYMLTRFSDIASFIGLTFSMILFPLASEAHEKGAENRKPLWHTLIGSLAGCLLLAVCFAVVAKPILALNSVWRQYEPYAYLLPFLTYAVWPSYAMSAIASFEYACNRIGSTAFYIGSNLLFASFLICFTGYEYFRGILPDSVVDWMASLHIAQLSTLTYLTAAYWTVAIACLLLHIHCGDKARAQPHHSAT